MAHSIVYVSDGPAGGLTKGKIASIVQGQSGQVLTLEVRDLGNNLVDLTGYSTITGRKRDASGNVTALVGTLTLSGTPTVAPQVSFALDEDDGGESGFFTVIIILSNGVNTLKSFPATWHIQNDPAVNATTAAGTVGVTETQASLLATLATTTGLAEFNGTGGRTAIVIQAFMRTFLAAATALAARAGLLPSYAGNATKVLTVNAGATDVEWVTPSSGGTWGTIGGTLSSQTDLQTALNGKETSGAAATVQGNLDTHTGNTSNPHSVTSAQVGAANVYNVKSATYGAVGDGVADDTTAILAAIAAAKAAGGGVVFLPKGTYLISKSLIMPSSVELRGAGVQSKITKAATVKSLLTANANAGVFTATVTDSTGFAVGKAIHLFDTSSVEWLSTQAVITNIAGNVITFDDAVDGNLQTARSAAASTSFPLIRNEAGSTDVIIRDLTLDQNANASDPANDFTLAIIHWVGAYRALVENCTLINACGDAYSDQAQDGTGITPAANLIVTCKNTIRGCKIRSAGRHGVHLGTCIRGGYILANDILDCPNGFGYFYCAYTTETIAANNRMENCFSGFAGIDERDYDNIIIGNTTKNMTTGFAVDATGVSGGRLIIANNLFLCDATAGADVKNARVQLNVPDSIFQGNVINMAAKTGEGLRIGANAARCIVSDNKIIGSSGAGGTTGCQIDAVADLRFSHNSIGSFSKAISLRGATRMIADGNQLSPVATCWNLEVATSTDCVIKNERTVFATPVTEGVAATRLIYEGVGTNGANDPASAGDWNAASGRRFDGTMVRWNSGGGEKVSIFYNGVGWTALN